MMEIIIVKWFPGPIDQLQHMLRDSHEKPNCITVSGPLVGEKHIRILEIPPPHCCCTKNWVKFQHKFVIIISEILSRGLFMKTIVVCFTEEINESLAKPPLILNGVLA